MCWCPAATSGFLSPFKAGFARGLLLPNIHEPKPDGRLAFLGGLGVAGEELSELLEDFEAN
jgi:hypothetical protein